jgi:DNA-binding transcriptional MocR family regulator
MIDGSASAVDRIAESLGALAAGSLPGTRMPSTRRLVSSHRASPLTVQRAIARLVAAGVLETQPGRGTFVAAADPEQPPPTLTADRSWQSVALGAAPAGGEELQSLLEQPAPGAIPLSSGYLEPALQPLGALGPALARAARRPGAWERGEIAGRPQLRQWFADQLDAGLSSDDVVICPGGQAALATAFRALARPGEAIVCESPTYLGALAAARLAGLTVVPVPSDDDGVRPELLDAALRRTRARLVYLQPLHANPHGAALVSDRRRPVLNAVRAAGAFVVEDDWARDLPAAPGGSDVAPLIADDVDGHVVHLRSMTKVASPGLRVAAVAARGPVVDRLRVARAIDDFYVAGPLQEATLELVTAPAWRRHRTALQRGLADRRDALMQALADQLPELSRPRTPRGGLHLWQPLPRGADDVAIAARARNEGVVVFPGRPWFAGEPSGSFLRLTYAAAAPDRLVEGVRRLARALA